MTIHVKIRARNDHRNFSDLYAALLHDAVVVHLEVVEPLLQFLQLLALVAVEALDVLDLGLLLSHVLHDDVSYHSIE